MRSLVSKAVLAAALSGLISCTSSQIRGPAASHNQDAQRLHALRAAAEAGVLFVVNDSVFQDRPLRQVGTCKKVEESAWAEHLFAVLEKFDQNPRLFSKIHTINIHRGNAPKASIEKDTLGASHLNLEYTKHRTTEKVSPMTELGCDSNVAEFIGRDLDIISYEWPTVESAVAVVSGAEDRANIEAYNFDRRFLAYLADQSVLLKVESSHLVDKNINGENILSVALAKYGSEVAAGNLSQIEFWIKEIGVNSSQSSPIEFFGLKKEQGTNYGIRIDSSGKYARKINALSDPTYLFVSYKNDPIGFGFPSLGELNSCLENLSREYRKPSFKNSFDMDQDSYLYPGYLCKAK